MQKTHLPPCFVCFVYLVVDFCLLKDNERVNALYLRQ